MGKESIYADTHCRFFTSDIKFIEEICKDGPHGTKNHILRTALKEYVARLRTKIETNQVGESYKTREDKNDSSSNRT